MLHLSVKIHNPYKGLHLCLAIIPKEYNIIIYCHKEWQWETVLLYSIAKQRKGSDVDPTAVSAHTVRACSSCRCGSPSPQGLQATWRNQKKAIQKVESLAPCVKTLSPKGKWTNKSNSSQMSTSSTVLNSVSAAVCGAKKKTNKKKQTNRTEST